MTRSPVYYQVPNSKRRYVPDLRCHLSQCEWNYHRLLKLLPELHSNDQRIFMVSWGEQVSRIELHITERSRYTTTLSAAHDAAIQHTPGENSSWSSGPNMVIRLYHDASMAEVLSCQQQRDFAACYDYPNPAMHQRDEKAQLNRFLGDWLSHCLLFGQVAEPVLSGS